MYVRVLQDELHFPDDGAIDMETKSLIRGVRFSFSNSHRPILILIISFCNETPLFACANLMLNVILISRICGSQNGSSFILFAEEYCCRDWSQVYHKRYTRECSVYLPIATIIIKTISSVHPSH